MVSLTLALGYLVVLGGTYLHGDFLIDKQGRPIANDFVDVVAAGRLARDGAAYSLFLLRRRSGSNLISSHPD